MGGCARRRPAVPHGDQRWSVPHAAEPVSLATADLLHKMLMETPRELSEVQHHPWVLDEEGSVTANGIGRMTRLIFFFLPNVFRHAPKNNARTMWRCGECFLPFFARCVWLISLDNLNSKEKITSSRRAMQEKYLSILLERESSPLSKKMRSERSASPMGTRK